MAMTWFVGGTVHEGRASVGIPSAPSRCRQTNKEIPDGDQVNTDFAKCFSSTAVYNHSCRSDHQRAFMTDEYPQPSPHAVHTCWAVPHGLAVVIPRGLWRRRFRFAVPQRRFRRGAGMGRIADMTRAGGVGTFS
jgi:hypothetical protein